MSSSLSGWVRDVLERPASNTKEERDRETGVTKYLNQRMQPWRAHLERRQQEARLRAQRRMSYADAVEDAIDELTARLRNGEALTDEMVEAYVGLTRDAENAEQSIGVDARNLDRLAEQMERPLDAFDALHEKFPILSARRPFGA